MSSPVPHPLEARIQACLEQAEALQRMASELTGEIRAIAALVGTQAQDRWRDDVQAMLHLHKSEIIQSLTGQHVNAAPPPLQHKFPFRLDSGQQEVRIGRRRIPLTPNEFKVLECLWANMPDLVSREAIVARLYDDKAVRSKRVVDVFVSNVRNKLRDAGATDVRIESKSGHGWKLILDTGQAAASA